MVKLFCYVLLMIFVSIYGDTVCPNTSKYPATVCPIGSACCSYQYSNNGYGCLMSRVDQQNATYCCAPGPVSNASKTLPNVMILGDSVSIGYERPVAVNLSLQAFVQHSPWDTRNGGAQSTSYGLSCLPIFLKNIDQQIIQWDLIMFNFGLHNLGNSSAAEATYKDQLTQITEQILSYNKNTLNDRAKIIYALTTPMMEDYNEGNHAVEDDNKMATQIMNNYSIPIVDLYQRVVDFCGPVPYVNCSICNQEPCNYHYTSQGYQWISVPINNIMRQYLNLTTANITNIAVNNTNMYNEMAVNYTDLYFGDY